MSDLYCLFWFSPCLSIEEWKDFAAIVATWAGIPGILIAACKALTEIRKLREERARERLSRIHAQQLDALRKLYERLTQVQTYSQYMTKSVIFEGEKVEEYPAQLSAAFHEARQEFTSARLLLPHDLVRQIENYFQQVVESQSNLGTALRMEAGVARAEFRIKAGTIAYNEMPLLLSAIESSARAIIHGEERPSENASA